jgi:hypothetical protein
VKWCSTKTLTIGNGFKRKKIQEYTERRAKVLLEKWGITVNPADY